MVGLRSVLFVDFDNIFGGLMNLDRAAGLVFARQPGRWLERLATNGLADGDRRRFLQCRAYLNPAGWIRDEELGTAAGRLHLQKFRPNLTRAGFEVIDCPSLTLGHKNAADIRIVIDVLDGLDSDPSFDEFVIASSDADFTPLLHRLRARGRRIVVVSAGNAAPSYRSVADKFIGPETLISILLDATDADSSTNLEATPSEPAGASLRDAAEQQVTVRLAESEVPLNLSNVGQILRSDMADAIDQSSWFGHGALTAFLRSVDGGRLRVDHPFVWDPDRHDTPDVLGGGAGEDSLPGIIQDLCAATDLPRLRSAAWPPLFTALADYADREGFTLTHCTASVRDRLRETDTPVSRGAVSFVVRTLAWQGVRLDDDAPPAADAMREAFQAGIVDRFDASGLMLDVTQMAMLDRWLRGAADEL